MLLLAPLAALALALPTQQVDNTAARQANRAFYQPKHAYPDSIHPAIASKVPEEELLKPDFNIYEWYHNATQDNPSVGWVSYLEGNANIVAWPHGTNPSLQYITQITYCYDSADVRNKISNGMLGAIRLWYTALGGLPRSDHKHSVLFVEAPEYCKDREGR